jgi:sec-independent protein translocase protein TatC
MYVAIFAAAAIITPSQDPFTFVILALPICLLYEGCILLARLRERAARRRRAADPVASLGDDQTSALDVAPSPIDAAPSALDAAPSSLPEAEPRREGTALR